MREKAGLLPEMYETGTRHRMYGITKVNLKLSKYLTPTNRGIIISRLIIERMSISLLIAMFFNHLTGLILGGGV